jgi:hypothetical protein
MQRYKSPMRVIGKNKGNKSAFVTLLRCLNLYFSLEYQFNALGQSTTLMTRGDSIHMTKKKTTTRSALKRLSLQVTTLMTSSYLPCVQCLALVVREYLARPVVGGAPPAGGLFI